MNILVQKTLTPLLLCVAIALLAAGDLFAENWPGFRGPSGNGSTAETKLPDRWSGTENVLWKQPIAGRGWSSPIVWNEKVLLTTAVADGEEEAPKKGLYFGGNRRQPRSGTYQWKVICLNKKTGDPLWETVCASGKPTSAIHLKNSYASETPITDGEHIFAYFGASGLFCLDLDGNRIWEKSLGSFEIRDGWGTSSSPVIDEENVYVQCFNEEESFVVALSKKTGDQVWRQEVEEKSSWSSPVLWKNQARTELITVGTAFARSFDPETGKLLWKLGKHSSIVCPTPIAGDDLLFLSSGYVMDQYRPIYAIKPGGDGDLTSSGKKQNASIAWSLDKAGPYNPSPLLYEGRLYVLLDRGFLGCYDAASGKVIYHSRRIDDNLSGFTSSPWAYDGKVYCLNEDGKCFVFQAGDEYKQLHSNALEEMCMATPAISDGTIFIRTIDSLYAIGSRNPLKNASAKKR